MSRQGLFTWRRHMFCISDSLPHWSTLCSLRTARGPLFLRILRFPCPSIPPIVLVPSLECFNSRRPDWTVVEFEHFDHGDVLVEHEDKFFAILLRAHLVLDMIIGLEVHGRLSSRTSGNLTKSLVMESVLFKTLRVSSMVLNSSVSLSLMGRGWLGF